MYPAILKYYFIPLLGLISLGISLPIQAQIIPDNTLNEENSQVNVQPLQTLIEGGALRGENLFHSFQEFNVLESQNVYFVNPESTNNILTRVTGENISNILGTLGVEGNANLYLINPNGIYFGENAKLDLNGSFFATTSDSIIFDNNYEFSATNPNAPPLLNLNITPGLQYPDNYQGNITNLGQLQVNSGETLSLQGNTVENQGQLISVGGEIEVLGNNIFLTNGSLIDVSSPIRGGDIYIGGDFQGIGNRPTANHVIIAPEAHVNANSLHTGDGGNIAIWSEETTAFYGNISATGENGGFVEVSSKDNLIFRGNVDTSGTFGDPGTLLLDPTNITIADGSGDGDNNGSNLNFTGNVNNILGQILSDDFAGSDVTIYESEIEGLAGINTLILQATNDIIIEDLDDNELTFPTGLGEGVEIIADSDLDGVGNVWMEDVNDTLNNHNQNLTITGQDLRLGHIRSGHLSLNAVENIQTGNIDTRSSTSAGGTVKITTLGNIETGNIFTEGSTTDSTIPRGDIFLEAGGEIATGDLGSSVYLNFGLLNGNVTVKGGESVSLGSIITNSLSRSAGVVNVEAGGDLQILDIDTLDFALGPDSGGAVTLKAKESLDVGNITTGLGFQLFFGVGGDRINLEAGENITTGKLEVGLFGSPEVAIRLQAGGDIQSSRITTQSGYWDDVSGAIALTAAGSIQVQTLNSSNTFADAGNITLNAGQNITIDEILATNPDVSEDNGGNISITGSEKVTLGQVSSHANTGNAGQITIEGGHLVLTSVDSSSQSKNGGNITLTSLNPFTTTDLNLNSNSTLGNGGDIRINAPQITLNRTQLNTTVGQQGNAGNIFLNATNTIRLQNGTQLFSTLNPNAKGRSGNITVTANQLHLNQYSFIDTGTFGQGNAGHVTLNTNLLGLENSSIFSITAGEGNAGNITINAQEINLNNSNISTAVNPRAVGQGGNVNITAQNLHLNNGAQIQALTRGTGNSGHVNLNITDLASFDGWSQEGFLSGVFTSTDSPNQKGGNITLQADELQLNNGAVLNAETSNSGDGGSITVNARNVRLTQGGQMLTNTQGRGAAGTIQVNVTDTLEITGRDPNFAQRPTPKPQLRDIVPTLPANDAILEGLMGSNTQDTAFNLNPFFSLTAVDDLNEFVGNTALTPYTSAVGYITEGDSHYYRFDVTGGTKGIFDVDTLVTLGDTEVNSFFLDTQLTLLDASGKILASNSDSVITSDPGSAFVSIGSGVSIQDPYISYFFTEPGSYHIRVELNDNLSFWDVKEGSYMLQTSLESPNVGGSQVTAGDVSGLFARSSSVGRGGDISIQSPHVSLSNNAAVSVNAQGTGNAGNININSNSLSLDNSETSATSTSAGAGGSIGIESQDVQLSNRAAISVNAQGTGNAGNININSNTLSLDNSETSATSTAAGAGGSIGIESQDVQLSNRAAISVNAQGTGNAGNIEIKGNNLFLDHSETSATSTSGEGGNLNIHLSENLILRHNSQISTRAGTEGEGGGNGGNMDISARYIAAVPQENSDITANAFEGNGGNISITAQGIFGLRISDKLTPFSEISASSELGIDGEITIDTPNTDPSQNLAELPSDVTDPTDRLSTACETEQENRFVFTGRGGIPENPQQRLQGKVTWEDTRITVSQESLEELETDGTIADHTVIWRCDG